MPVTHPTRTVGIYLFDDVEVLDFAGAFEVFSTAARLKARHDPESKPAFRVLTLAATPGNVTARGGLIILPENDLSTHPELDVLIIPGGVVTNEMENSTVLDWIRRVSPTTEITASICTGAFLLARTGLLDGLPATTHWEDQADLQSMFPGIEVQSNKRWVDNGRIVTSAGISAGIEMSLHLVARLENEALAVKTARQMEFFWNPDRVDE